MYGKRVVDIDYVPVHLRLFSIVGEDIVVYVAQLEEPKFEPRRFKRSEVINKSLTVKITSENAKKFKDYKKP
jgi:hypothetical protein